MRTPLLLAGLTAAALVGGLVVVPTAQAATELDLDARLSGGSHFSSATGFSEYERLGAQREVEVTVNHITRLADKDVKVYVNGQWVGRMHVRSAGFAHREWDTDRGQAVPFASAGDSIRVRTMTGTLVSSGTYHVERD